jgi:DNA replicative helicase MCM subunit Mcm2 (Cdc46/Mcm family)
MAEYRQQRFAQMSEDEMQINAENTIRTNKKCANSLREYLKENKQNSEFETFDRVRLNENIQEAQTPCMSLQGVHVFTLNESVSYIYVGG